jgi:DNA transformation protein and related proteins
MEDGRGPLGHAGHVFCPPPGFSRCRIGGMVSRDNGSSGMASTQSTIDYILEQIAGAGHVRARHMFGEFALYCDDKVVALVCDDRLLLKKTLAARVCAAGFADATPFPGAKAWFHVPGEVWDDADELAALIRATANELPLPKPKPKKAKRKR